MRLFGTMVCRTIKQSRLKRFRDELSASFILSPRICSIGRQWHYTMLIFRLFPIAPRLDKLCRDWFQKCVIHPVAFTICCHEPMTPTSPAVSEEHPYTLNLVIEPTVTNHSSTLLFLNSNRLLPFLFLAPFTNNFLAL